MAHTPLAGERLRPLGHLSNWVLNEGGKDTIEDAEGKALIRSNLYFLQRPVVRCARVGCVRKFLHDGQQHPLVH